MASGAYFCRPPKDSGCGTQQSKFTYAKAVISPRPPEERLETARSSSANGGENFPIEATEPIQCNQRKDSYHPCMYDELKRHNYKKKFSELVKCEQKTHQEILQAKCSGDCTLVITTDLPPSRNDWEPTYEEYGYLRGLSDDQIAYVSQSADHREGVIIMAKNRKYEVCRAAILRRNYSHTDIKLYIGFDRNNKTKVLARFKHALTRNGNVPIHVKFNLKNSYFRNLSQSAWRIPPAIITKIMPDAQSLCMFDDQDLEKHLPKGSFSTDQLQALKMIVSSSSSGPPCLITGPFGTGKSHLLAAAAYWLFHNSQDTMQSFRILVCTQQRESADNFFQLYQGLMSKEKDATAFIVRDYGFHNRKLRRWYKTVNQFKQYVETHYDSESDDIENYLIIMPCLTALTLQRANFLPPNFFTHIFIDEGAQMREVEAIAPLSMASENTKIVIAGDPWQVGPSMLVLGERARKNGLAISLLERLVHTYQSSTVPPDFKKMISFLDCCHRCHEDILNLSARLFYKVDLKTPENEPSINHPKFKYPLLFICSSINEEEKLKATKNDEEAKVVLEYAELIAANWPNKLWGGQYHLDMCAMSPTRSQLTTILELIQSGEYSSKLMEVRRVPTFFMQGKEYKVLLLSTSEPMTDKGASANPTKSLCNPYVFNTAITRAQSLVVCIGNPFLLLKMEENMIKQPGYEEIGKCWSNYFKCCLEHETMEIAELLSVSKEQKEEIFMKIKDLAEKRLKEKIQYPSQTEIEEEMESQTTVFAEDGFQSAVYPSEMPQPMISPHVSTTDIESTTVEPLSTDLDHETGSQVQDEVQHPQILQISSDTDLSELEQPSPSTPISEFESKYELKGSLGDGGFGVVFRVKYTLDKSEYALKVIPLPEEDAKQGRLLREIVALARLDHPHIVRYYHSWKERAPEKWQDKPGWQEMRSRFLSFAQRISSSSSTPAQSNARISQPSGANTDMDSVVSFRPSRQMSRGEVTSFQSPSSSIMRARHPPSPSISVTASTSTDNQTLVDMLSQSPPTCLFIRMELCKEETLKDLLAKCNKEDTRRKKDMFDYFEQMLSALRYIHGKGYIHRDLKPSNIFFSREEGRLKIGDFGLVTTDNIITNDPTAHYSERKSRSQAGTPCYASPEQLVKGKQCCPKADIYTLGLICFELHYICRNSGEKTKVFTALKGSSIKFPPDFLKRIYKEVPNLIKRMLAKEPSARPSADEIIESDDFKVLKRKVNKKKAAKQPYIPLL